MPGEDLVVGFAVLCHDLGKPLTTRLAEDGRIRSMHEPKGEKPTRTFLSRLTNQVTFHDEVVPLVRRHLTPRIFYQDQASDGAIRRLAKKVKRIDRLVRVAAADLAGAPSPKGRFPRRTLVAQTSRGTQSQGFRAKAHPSGAASHPTRTSTGTNSAPFSSSASRLNSTASSKRKKEG